MKSFAFSTPISNQFLLVTRPTPKKVQPSKKGHTLPKICQNLSTNFYVIHCQTYTSSTFGWKIRFMKPTTQHSILSSNCQHSAVQGTDSDGSSEHCNWQFELTPKMTMTRRKCILTSFLLRRKSWKIYISVVIGVQCHHSFDTVGWATERSSGLQ